MLRLRGDGACDPELIEASGESFHRLAAARAGSRTIVFAEVLDSALSLVTTRFGVPSGSATFLCVSRGEVHRQFSAVAAVDASRMSQIVDSAALESDGSSADLSPSCGS